MEFKVNQQAIQISTNEPVIILSNRRALGNTGMFVYSAQSLASGKIKECFQDDLRSFSFAKSIDQAFKGWEFRDYSDFRRTLTHIRIKGELTNILYSMHYGNVEFKPHQYKPVMKFLQSTDGRLLIADEVGLGKTVEALYIWKELQSRDEAKRLLVVCPHSLTDKWKSDMKRLFSIESDTVNAKQLLKKCEDVEQRPNVCFSYVTGIEAIRCKNSQNSNKTPRDEFYSFLTNRASDGKVHEPIFDLVIVDEAHILRNSSTANYKIVEALRECSKNLILLSATPIQTNAVNLFNLLRILEPEEYQNQRVFQEVLTENETLVSLANLFYKRHSGSNLNEAKKTALECLYKLKRSQYFKENPLFDEISSTLDSRLTNDELRIKTFEQVTKLYFYDSILSRTRKKDVPGLFIPREVQTIKFRLSEKELEVYRTVTQRFRNTIRANATQIHEFVIMLKQREMASCMPAALRKWSTFYQNDILVSDLYEELFGDNTNNIINLDGSSSLLNGMSISDNDIQELEKHDSKYEAFKNKVIETILKEDPNKKIIVFSFFTATLEYLEKRLSDDGFSVLRIDGSIKDRTTVIEQFKTSDTSILLSSEVGSEGIDLQFANIEVNYDLPWNPMRLEQRIGRIDRIGQTSKRVNIVNLICDDTVEDKILFRLYERIEIFKKSIGEIDEILGTLTTDIQRDLLKSNLSEQQIQQHAEDLITAQMRSRQLSQQLEEKAGISEEYNQVIMQYIEETSRNNRFIRREDLINYIDDYFNLHGAGSTILAVDSNKNSNEFRKITLSQQANSSYQSFISNNAGNRSYTYHNGITNGLICCFPQGKNSEKYVNIDINDSIIRWIYDETEKNRGLQPSNCFAIKLRSSNCQDPSLVKKGVYVFFIKEINFTGIRVRREMFHIVINVNTKEILPLSTGEYLLSQALFNGEPITNLENYKKSSATLNNRLDACIDYANYQYEKAAESFVSDNENTFVLQLNKATKIFEYQKQTIQEVIDGLPVGSPAIRMNQGKLKSTEENYNNTKDRLNRKRKINTESENLAAGLLFVF